MIDIVLATYNGEKYISEQIDSIIGQSFKDWRLIIRDDGSKDKTPQILHNYSLNENRIKVIKDNLGNLGFNGNFTKLLENSDAEYVMICDQDDFWVENKVEVLYNEIKKYRKNESVLVHSDVYLANEKLEIIGKSFIGKRGRGTGINSVIMANSVQGASIMMTKTLKDIFLKERVGIPYDYNIALIAEMIGKRIYIEQPLMYYRQHVSNAIGADVSKKGEKNSLASKLKKKFSTRLISMELGKGEAVEDLRKKLSFQISKYTSKAIDDYLYLTDNSKSWIIKVIKFYKNRYKMYRRIDSFLAPVYFLMNRSK